MKKINYVIAAAIFLICSCLIVLRWLWPELIIDQTTVLLLAMAILPWLTLFFKKLKIPGIIEGETYERTQGITEKPLPPKESPVSVPQLKITSSTLSNDAKKILATLWKYQKQHFKEDYSRRWTFRVFPVAYQYSSYLSGLSELIKSGLVVVSPENEQCMLTNEGINFVVNNTDIQSIEDIYKF